MLSKYFLKKIVYHKVASSGLSRLIAQPHFQNVYEGKIWCLCTVTLDQTFLNWIVDRSTARYFYHGKWCYTINYGLRVNKTYISASTLFCSYTYLANIHLYIRSLVSAFQQISAKIWPCLLRSSFNLLSKTRLVMYLLGENFFKLREG